MKSNLNKEKGFAKLKGEEVELVCVKPKGVSM